MRMKFLSAVALALAVAIVVPTFTSARWPVVGGGSYVSQRFHDGHRGIDIAARRGTSVVPLWSGTVIFAGYRRNCGGHQVWLSHPNNVFSAYYHLARDTTSRGNYVRGSIDRIGYVGMSGCATGPHVHVEIWKGYPWRMGSYRVNPWGSVMSGPHLPSRYR